MENEKKSFWDNEKRHNFREALIQGFFHDLATKNGGTGMYRRAWSAKEAENSKKRRKLEKQGRKNARRRK
jgi:hypothetical protein